MKNGVKPIKKDHRNYSTHTFGTTFSFVTEINLDAGFGFPNQNADGLPEACTGYTQSEICQDMDKFQYKPKFTYEKTLFMMNAKEGEPCDMQTSLKSLSVYGVQGINETTDAEASKHLKGGYFQIEKVGDWFDGIRSAITINNVTSSSATQWFESFGNPAHGIISDNSSGAFSWHNYKICGWKVINGETYLIAKSWQGSQYGDSGYCYFSRDQINKLLSTSGAGAFIVKQYDLSVTTIKTVELGIFQTILSYFRRWLESLNKKPVEATPVPVVDHYKEVKEAVQPQPKRDLLTEFCTAISEYEGGPGDLNHRNNNPGNCRGLDGKFLIFKTWDEGFAYLKDYVTRACTGRHQAYKPTFTITQFFQVFSPTLDKNNPELYATTIAGKLKIPVTTQIRELLT